ncbi:MAG: hypothetical protein N3A38_13845 [Planctomycetota bacterium]|nr:hypothetical protein [Planctomycetota bacterium]
MVKPAPAAAAILDRFLHRTGIIAINGKSYRPKDRASRKRPDVVYSPWSGAWAVRIGGSS